MITSQRVAAGVVLLAIAASSGSAQRPKRDSTPAPNESDYYRMVTLPIPEHVVLEVGGLETLPDGRLAVATRRGEVWLVENPESANGRLPHFTRFAQGLHEALGLTWHDGALYTAQRSELTRLRDTDGDGRANRYETVYSWPLSGNYHEYSFGPAFSPKGGDDMIVTLNLAWVGFGDSFVKWRGWMLRIGTDGSMTPVAAGFRSPSSFGYNLEGDLFYSENQGDWVGSGHLTHVEPGDFVGNPTSLRWSGEPRSPVKLGKSDIPDSGEPKYDVAKRVPGLKPPAVWFPHTILGISTSAILVDSTRGAFGPFAGQLFVGDQGQSKIMRVFLEKVNGVYQGIAFPFREGFTSGVLRQTWGRDGSMYVGQTSRGWSATGTAPFGLQRLVWTGKVPFEAHRVEARPDGFEIVFTMPVDRAAAADPSSYKVSSFTYKYHHFYGSPVINESARAIRAVVVSPDGLRARLVVDSLRRGYIHEIMMSGVRSESGAPLLHDFGYYTVNQIPTGPSLTIAPGSARTRTARRSAKPVAASASNIAALAKRQTDMPDDWNGKAVQSVSVAGLDGLRFSIASFEVKAGARLRIDFANQSDMLHNLVIVRPGGLARVAAAALKLGLDGMKLNFVPPMGEVLYHTGLLEPRQSEAIFFEAPTTPGDYPFVCSFPGHAVTMQGVMRVRR